MRCPVHVGTEGAVGGMNYEEALHAMDRDERFRATVYAMNTLLLRKGVYRAQEFERLFCEHAENHAHGFRGKRKRA